MLENQISYIFKFILKEYLKALRSDEAVCECQISDEVPLAHSHTFSDSAVEPQFLNFYTSYKSLALRNNPQYLFNIFPGHCLVLSELFVDSDFNIFKFIGSYF